MCLPSKLVVDLINIYDILPRQPTRCETESTTQHKFFHSIDNLNIYVRARGNVRKKQAYVNAKFFFTDKLSVGVQFYKILSNNCMSSKTTNHRINCDKNNFAHHPITTHKFIGLFFLPDIPI